MKVLVTPTSLKPGGNSPALEKLQLFAGALVFNPQGRPLSEDELIPLLDGCDGFIAGLDSITKKVMDNAGSLKVISRYGIGVDNVDLEAARARNIVVCNTPGANSQAVADLTLALMLCAARKLTTLDRKTREGQWPRSTGIELYGKTLGILGLGAVGRAVAKRAAGFSMRIIAYDPFIDVEYAAANNIISLSFDEVIKEADFLCLHLPLTEETRQIISAGIINTMKKGAIIVNTARGGLIDEIAAYEALKQGHLGGMGLDVYESEPPGASPLLTLDNVVITPHTAAHTVEAMTAMANMAVQNLIDVLSGRDCPFIVNG